MGQIHDSHLLPFAHLFACLSAAESSGELFGVAGSQEAQVPSAARLSPVIFSMSANFVLCKLVPGQAQLSEDLG